MHMVTADKLCINNILVLF